MEKLPVYCFECQSSTWNTSNGTLKCTAPKGLHRTVELNEFCSWGEKQEDDMKKMIEAGPAIAFADTFFADPILKAAAIALVNHAPAADVATLNSAEKQAVFCLGQMDMREAVVAMLKDAANRASGITRAALLDAASMVANLEVAS